VWVFLAPTSGATGRYFSPTGALNETMAVVGKNLEASRSGGA
jgi:hypothetical protein